MIGRLLAVVGVLAATEAVLAVTGHDLHPVEVALLAAVGVLVIAVGLQLEAEPRSLWAVRDPEVVQPPVERRLAAYARMIESNQTARQPDPLVRDLLRRIADERLDRRHGLTRADPAAVPLLGLDLLSVLDGPPRRITPHRLSAYLDRIEAL